MRARRLKQRHMPLPPRTQGKINIRGCPTTERFSSLVHKSRGYQSPSVVSFFILAIKKITPDQLCKT